MVILSNRGNTTMPEAVRNSLIDLLLGLPWRDWNALLLELGKQGQEEGKAREKEREETRHRGTNPSREPAAYAGAYEEAAYGTAGVSLENGSLTLQWSSFHSRLEHYHYDTFTTKNENPIENQPVVFTLGADGEVATMSFLGVEFRRVKPKPEPSPPEQKS